jgi:hypothetical protein
MTQLALTIVEAAKAAASAGRQADTSVRDAAITLSLALQHGTDIEQFARLSAVTAMAGRVARLARHLIACR